jgi:hypothetical protein
MMFVPHAIYDGYAAATNAVQGATLVANDQVVEFEQLADRVVFGDYLAEVTAAGERIKRLEAALRQCAETSDQVAMIRHSRPSVGSVL